MLMLLVLIIPFPSVEGHAQITGTTLLCLRSAPPGGYGSSSLVMALDHLDLPIRSGLPLQALMRSGETPMRSRPCADIESGIPGTGKAM